jgi:hypothetical protein
MECWHCGGTANGVCRFCGRALCKKCASTLPVILSVFIGKEQTPKAVVVGNTLFCGECWPQPDPIEMPEIF